MAPYADPGQDASSAPFPPPRLAWYVVGVMTVGWILAFLDRQIIGILIESLRRDLGLSDTQISLLQGAAFALFFVFAGIPIGRLVDRANRKSILLAGMLIWSGTTIASGFATNFWQLFACRLGVGSARRAWRRRPSPSSPT